MPICLTRQAPAVLNDADNCLKDGKPFLITGSPGGTIISAVLQVIVNAIDFKMPIGQAVSAPRLHQQWQPEDVYVEPGFAPDASMPWKNAATRL
jgi:gamma-glutamyltranspeptidase